MVLLVSVVTAGISVRPMLKLEPAMDLTPWVPSLPSEEGSHAPARLGRCAPR
jgi:hypothetical protein